MKSGRRAPNPASKQLAGTYRKDRHANIVELVTPARDEPIQPGYLSAEAKAVWAEEAARVVACGVTSADSSLFARYCECEATFRVSVLAGDLPKAALLTELRRMAELLGIAGLKSRLGRGSAPAADKPAVAFTVRK